MRHLLVILIAFLVDRTGLYSHLFNERPLILFLTESKGKKFLVEIWAEA